MFDCITRARPRLGISHRRLLSAHDVDALSFQRSSKAINAAPKRFWSSVFQGATWRCGQSPPDGVYQGWNRRFSWAFQFSEARGSRQASGCGTNMERCQLTSSDKTSQRSNTALVKRRSSLSASKSSRRSLNLKINGENSAKNEQAVREIIVLLQQCENIDVVRLWETCSMSLIVRHPESELWLGLSVKATTARNRNQLRFYHCHKSPGVLNICTALPSLVRESFRWWVIPGEQLRHSTSGVLTITLSNPKAKWGCFEVRSEKLASVILQELLPRAVYQQKLSEWSTPKSEQHRRERDLFLQSQQKVFLPLGCKMKDPEMARTPIDVIIDDIYVQNKTAYVNNGMLGLRINLQKHGGRNENGLKTAQPYSVDDGIDAIIANVPQGANLVGLFIFSSEEIAKHGWFRGNGNLGEMFIQVYPPFTSAKKSRKWVQQWQLEYYLDLSREVDLDRARMLLDRCKKSRHCLDQNKGELFCDD